MNHPSTLKAATTMTSHETSLRLLRVEILATNTFAAMSIMVPFYNSIGMDQGQIGLSQSIFMLALFVLNIPTGWLADKISRKFCNAFGDLVAGAGFAFYAFAGSFEHVLIAEVVIGIGLAFTQGADEALIRAYTDHIDSSHKLFRTFSTSLASWRPIAQIVAVLLGGVIGAYEPRLAIFLSAIPYVIGGLLSLKIREAGERLVSEHRNPLRDMARLVNKSLRHDVRLRWLILAHAVGQKITHVMIWALTPLLLLAGVPLAVVAVGWALNAAMVSVGALFARWWSMRLNEWQRFAVPTCVVLVTLGVMSIHLSLWTIWLYVCLGLAQGWLSIVTKLMIQLHAPASEQAMVMSVTQSVSQLLYIPLVWIIGLIGVIDIRLTMVATVVIFTPLVIQCARRLSVHELR